MTRRIPDGSIILTSRDCRLLYDVARLGPLRQQFRVGDNRVYLLLREISEAAFSDAASGNEPRQDAASEEARKWWTTEQLGKAAGRAGRTVRNDIALGILSATKTPNGWLIDKVSADTYIESRRSS